VKNGRDVDTNKMGCAPSNSADATSPPQHTAPKQQAKMTEVPKSGDAPAESKSDSHAATSNVPPVAEQITEEATPSKAGEPVASADEPPVNVRNESKQSLQQESSAKEQKSFDAEEFRKVNAEGENDNQPKVETAEETPVLDKDDENLMDDIAGE